jgi:hypothetical protein
MQRAAASYQWNRRHPMASTFFTNIHSRMLRITQSIVSTHQVANRLALPPTSVDALMRSLFAFDKPRPWQYKFLSETGTRASAWFYACVAANAHQQN